MPDSRFDEDDEDLDLLRQIDVVCSEFDRLYRDGQAPRLEEFLSRIPPSGLKRGFRELLGIELECRSKAGEVPTAAEYTARFPQFEALIRSLLPESGPTVQRVAPPDSESDTGSAKEVVECLPEIIGPYRIERRLGGGGFGTVYLARDPVLPRFVALKVPRPHRVQTAEQRKEFIRDAELASRLSHPHVVVIHGVQVIDGTPVIIQEYLPGGDLRRQILAGPISCQQAVAWLLRVAEGVAAAHDKNILHRDLKPANILLDEHGQPKVVDFGLALHEQDLPQHRAELAGTEAYMSPEQVRREINRLDARSDIWSLGVVLYELLTRRRPFVGSSESIIAQINLQNPRSPRDLDPDIPEELQRICLKCLEKQVSRRYPTVRALAADLERWQQAGPGPSGIESKGRESVPVVPRGLRSFDARDAAFFLDLLPGSRDRDGLPESVWFWKDRLEERDPDQTFAVGVLHGPSGCGKSSLVKAGILPQISNHVISIFIEATPADTEVRLLNSLRRQFPAISQRESLPEVLAGIRDGRWGKSNRKLLIIFDQFEQWLHAGNLQGPAQLIDALRHCDGGQLQCLVLVREDFWTSVNRFMQQLDIPLQEDRNAKLVDRFDRLHARTVLERFGRAYGQLPAAPAPLGTEEDSFLDAAIEQLSEEGWVVCVRLVLFGEMFKRRNWTLAELEEVGGAQGLGVAFLEDTFAAKSAAASQKNFLPAVRKILEQLLPATDTDIKGAMQTRQHLQQACGYTDKSAEFEELMRLLSEQYRLVTVTDPETSSAVETDLTWLAAPRQYFQLTHDYLVPSIREWLRLKEAETIPGRARLILVDRASLWKTHPENRHLPSLVEFLSIRFRTDRAYWSPVQREMMQTARLYYGQAAGMVLALLVVVAIVVQQFLAVQEQRATIDAVNALQSTSGSGVAIALDNLRLRNQSYVLTELQKRYDDLENPQRLPILYAFARFGRGHADDLLQMLPDAGAEECENFVDALAVHRDAALLALDKQALKASRAQNYALKTRLATIAMYLGDPSLAAEMLQAEPPPNAVVPTWDPVERTTFIETFPKWRGNLENLAELIRKTEDVHLRSGICLAVGSVEGLRGGEKQAWKRLLADWHVNHRDRGTHGATDWALRRLGSFSPVESSDRPRPGYEWHQIPTGLTLLRIPAGQFWRPADENEGQSPKPILIPRDYWIADREITVGLFRAFLKEAARPVRDAAWWAQVSKHSPTDEHPILYVTLDDVCQFCNWLSRRAGKDMCYVKHADNDWEVLPNCNGFRLPTRDEWEHACRARTTTAFAHGSDSRLLDRYAVFRQPVCEKAGSKLCNAWGLFDMHGNAAEWTHTDLTARDPRTRMLRNGGSLFFSDSQCWSDSWMDATPDLKAGDLGFRVMCPLEFESAASITEAKGQVAE
ncbi:MAG: protein kinase [Planctomycetes bacterium]|nr:protein kinase [Planctomycetota bacterium]